jgi:general secretion pathway protein G
MQKILALLLLFASCAEATTTRLSRAEGDFNSISSALKMFKVNAGRYPTEEEGLAALVEKPPTFPVNRRWSKT